ncbi:MAG: hypothetical protein ACRC7O_11475 [Fimbriiglobus sp.]
MKFLFTADDIRFPVYIGVDATRAAAVRAAGLTPPPRVLAHAILDTGTNVTIVSAGLAAAIGLQFLRRDTTQTGGGVVATDLYLAEIVLPPIFGLTAEVTLANRLIVATLPGLEPGIDVLFGLDLLLVCRLEVDGPNRTFSLHV